MQLVQFVNLPKFEDSTGKKIIFLLFLHVYSWDDSYNWHVCKNYKHNISRSDRAWNQMERWKEVNDQ